MLPVEQWGDHHKDIIDRIRTLGKIDYETWVPRQTFLRVLAVFPPDIFTCLHEELTSCL